MFKAFTQRDWAIFTQTYGQPVRIGKFHESASEQDKATLFRAVANIAGDCAAIVPSSMEIEFVEAKNISAGSDLYERRADWLDRQVSKAVLGQTNTTDAQAGGMGSGQADVHNEVRGDIEMADCKALSAVINRDLVRPWIDLEYGPQKAYPRLIIARPKPEDLNALVDNVVKLVGVGMKIQQSEVRDKLGLSDPDAGADLLTAPRTAGPPTLDDEEAPVSAPQSADPDRNDRADEQAPQAPAAIAERLALEADPAMMEMATSIEAMIARASDMSELRVMLESAFKVSNSDRLGRVIAEGIAAAQAAGHFDVVDESD